MTRNGAGAMAANIEAALPKHRSLYYGGAWHEPLGGYQDTLNPATGESLGPSAQANAADVDAAVRAAHSAYLEWRQMRPRARGALLTQLAATLHAHAEELALLDAANCGNPVAAMVKDVHDGAEYIDYFAGLATELKGDITPIGDQLLNLTFREPLGVCARIVAYNHPLMFAAMKIGAPLATGNTLIIKPSPQAPLSAYRMMELMDGILPPGVLNLLSGARECGEALSAHPQIPMVTLVGSVESGRACATTAANRLKRVSLELGGKNAMIIYPDADIPKAIEVAVRGMNFAWCGQSCGSTSRLFIHEDVYQTVLAGVLTAIKQFKPGIPTDRATTMGAVVSKAQLDKILRYIEIGKAEGARLAAGGAIPSDPRLAKGFFVEPTVFCDVNMTMRIANEEIFGPVLAVLSWRDEEAMFAQVNAVDYGLTASICTTNLSNAHRAARRVEAGYVWVNNAGPHYVGVPFGGYKQSGVGREESIEELFAFSQAKNVNITL
ncbi:MAG: aldehyde dehydrogenase family protein [Steroidobacteraceae bacterium]